MIAYGATADPTGTSFRVRAPTATAVTLCLFDGDAERRLAMASDGEDWTLHVPGVGPGARYGYRADGLPHDSAKLLVDPYAVAIDRPFRHGPALLTFGAETAHLVPRAIVPEPALPVAQLPPLFRPGGLIYEVSVRGFTATHPDIPVDGRGTVAALAHPAVIAHLRRLHVSAVELMPVVAWIDERHLPPLGLANEWGYNPVAMMPLDPRLAPGGAAELRDTVAALRRAGIGVILDLVLNHTGESDEQGTTLSLRGLDPAAYAREPGGTLTNVTGTGNTLDARRPAVLALWLATLRHFASFGVDGFRLDLATVVGRTPDFDPAAPFFAAVAADPLLADRVWIAEPWDVASYQLGRFPPGWLEWNDRFRDDVRRFWRGDGRLGTLATRIAGSSDLFPGDTRTVNFLAAHDGFTLADAVSHAQRHNEANGEGNRDGSPHEVNWNCGVEGPSDDPAIRARRARDLWAMIATLFASKGTIMLAAGDEFGRTQGGNNNGYAQPFALDWVGRDRALEALVAELSALRAARPGLAAPGWREPARWLTLAGLPMTAADWEIADGFELRVAGLSVRVDRVAGRCTLAPLDACGEASVAA